MMTAKEVLGQLARKDARIEGMRERLQRYRELAEGQRARLYSLPGGGQRRTSSWRNMFPRSSTLRGSWMRRSTTMWTSPAPSKPPWRRWKTRVCAICCRWRYMGGWSWERISRAMGYEQRQVYRLHALALSAFARAWGTDDCA